MNILYNVTLVAFLVMKEKTVLQTDDWSLAPDSPCSVRSGGGSSTPRTFSHESRVASSSALIQLDRPANLPAKSEEEEARHRLEYQQMVEAARKKGKWILYVLNFDI